jgi:hypothetical protein
VEDSLGKPPAVAGTDFSIARDGKIAAVYLFFDELRCSRSRRGDINCAAATCRTTEKCSDRATFASK